jgi:hypothetical protein
VTCLIFSWLPSTGNSRWSLLEPDLAGKFVGCPMGFAGYVTVCVQLYCVSCHCFTLHVSAIGYAGVPNFL